MADNLYISSSKIMEEKHFLKFSKRIIVFLIIIVLLDQISGFILRKGFFNMKAGETYRTTYTLDSVKTDIIVLGASRANHHYVPKIFERNLNMSFYNAGRDGSGLLNNYVMFKAIIERYSPKLIVFDLMPSELIYSENAYERLTTLLPYYSNHAEIRDVLELRSPFEKYKLCSAIYPFNSLLLRILFRNLESLKETDNSKKGYLPLYNKMGNIKADNSLNVSIGLLDSYKTNALKDIAKVCNKNNIRLVFVYSPVFSNSKKNITTEIIKLIVKQEGCQYFDFSNDTTFDNHPEYFQDNVHLNNDGAIIFTQMIIDKLKSSNHIHYH